MKKIINYLNFLFFIGLVFGQGNPNPERFKKNPQGDKTFIELFQLWDKKNSVPENSIVFVGSSSIRKWETSVYFPDVPIINRGFGGSHISDVNHYVNETVLKYRPKLIVFYAGDNDINYGKTAERVLGDYIDFVKSIHSKLPETKIIYIPIKPSLRRWSLWSEMKKANKLIYNYSSKNILLHYIDLASPMLGTNGLPKDVLFVRDSLHLSKEGYDLWSELIGPIIRAEYK